MSPTSSPNETLPGGIVSQFPEQKISGNSLNYPSSRCLIEHSLLNVSVLSSILQQLIGGEQLVENKSTQ